MNSFLSARVRRLGAIGWFVWVGMLTTPSVPAQDIPLPEVSSITILAPKSGAHFAVPGQVIIEAEAVDPLGDIRHLEFFANGEFVGASDYLLKIATIPGRPIPHRLEWKVTKPGAYRLVAFGKDTATREVISKPVDIVVTGEPESEGFALIQRGSSWRYLNDGTDPGGTWNVPGFDDSKWGNGEAQLGYGDGDEKTVTRTGEGPHPVTAYFRQSFQFPADLAVSRIRIQMVRDDGAVVYLNGKELLRDNMPRGEVTFRTLASDGTDDENAIRAYSVESTGLVAGENLLAVEVHQASVTSSDMSFDLAMTAVSQSLEDLPRVSLLATREATSEPRPEARIAPGQFTVRRTGSVRAALSVLVIQSGSATAELDYPKLPNVVTIPEGKEEVSLEVIALDDDLVEGEETVVLEIVQPPIFLDPLALNPRLQPPPTYRIDSEHSRAQVVIHDADSKTGATIEIREPEPGSRFPALATIPIRAVAVDPKGAITRVEFFSGRQSIGVSEIVFIREPDPGTPIEHTLEWKGAEPGEHLLTARGRNAEGVVVESAVVPVLVGVEGDVVVLEVEAADPRAGEPVGTLPADVGVFVIRRTGGPKDVAVPISYSVDGSALNGVDYERLTGRAELPEGVDEVRVVVTPIADKAKESEEKVLIQLEPPICPAIFPPPPQCYRIGSKGSAVVLIHDGDATQNRSPVALIVSPRSGSAFAEGEALLIRAEATDSDGTIERLDILADGALLTSSKDAAVLFDWKDAKVGLHKLTARAVDDSGNEDTSPVVTVMVRAAEEVAFVHRDLPPAYLPGTPMDVALLGDPPRGGTAWTVEDMPPQGWAVSEISDEGAYDATTGKVKFGPFVDAQSRRLTYRVAVPAGTTGAQIFTGRSSLDGRSLPVAGDGSVQPAGEHHPADATPVDKSIVADELTAYAAAWKRGTAWGTDGGTIPVAYVTRAGLIWKSGEAYRFDAAAGAPPACWVPTTTRPSGLSLAGRSRGLAVVEVPGGVAERHAEPIQKPGLGGRVEIHIQPPPGTLAVAIEETVPSGWQVSAVSDDGVYDPVTGKIRWGLFFGDAVRLLTYMATPPAGVAGNSTWHGVISFDGVEVVITGVGWIGAGDEATMPRIRGSHREGKGKVRFEVDAAPDQILVVEGSDDLRTWLDVGVVVHTGEDIEVSDASAEGAAQRYYRLRPLSR